MLSPVQAPRARRRPGGPRRLITVERQDIVGRRMDYVTHAREALDAAGFAQQLVARQGLTPITAEALRAIGDTRKSLAALLTALLAEAGCLDGLCDDSTHRHPGHGRGA